MHLVISLTIYLRHLIDGYAVLQVGLSQARRLAQGSVIKIHISSSFPVQIDGEPFILQPGSLEITHYKQV